MFDRGCTSKVDLCPVTSADQWKNCAREAHRDSVTSTHILQMLFILLVFNNKERQYLTKIDNGKLRIHIVLVLVLITQI